MKRKTIALIILNVAAAMVTGLCAGILYKNYQKKSGAAGNVPEASSGDVFYPMLSVFKFHQALAVCGWLRQGGIPLDTEVDVTPDMLQENTWSPLRDEHPQGGRFPYGTLLTYSLVQSDNNACDILFSLTGGPAMTDRYIRSLGVDGFDIECTEAMMHENLAACSMPECENIISAISAAVFGIVAHKPDM